VPFAHRRGCPSSWAAAITLQPANLLRLGADHAVLGKGEHAFRSLLDTLARGGKLLRMVRAASPSGLFRS